MSSDRPIIVAFDGSPESEAAVRAAAELFPARLLVVASVWEPGLALALTPPTDSLSGLATPVPDPETIRRVDRSQHDHASEMAANGVKLAEELGATAEPLAAVEERHVAETIERVAAERDAAAIVVGSRGLGRVKSSLLGSTSRGVMHHTRRPVVVVRTED